MQAIKQLVESRFLFEAEVNKRRECKGKIRGLESFTKLHIQQKAKICWLTDGDENARFFRNSFKRRNRKIDYMAKKSMGCGIPSQQLSNVRCIHSLVTNLMKSGM